MRQGRAIATLIEEAAQEDLVAAAITDLATAEIAETQIALMPELRGLPELATGSSTNRSEDSF